MIYVAYIDQPISEYSAAAMALYHEKELLL